MHSGPAANNPSLGAMSDQPGHTEAPIELADYDPTWPIRFEAEAAALRASLQPWLAGPIEHIGSTAVVGLLAKPVIDMMAAVESLSASEPARAAVAKLGYHYAPYRPDVMHWFCKPGLTFRTHHLHLVPYVSPLWQERLAFRDGLRASAELVREYAVLKRQLAERYPLDREAYTDAKGPFVRRVLQQTGGR